MSWTNREAATGDALPVVLTEYIARLLFAAVFIYAVMGKLAATAVIQELMTATGVPAILIWPAVLLELAIAVSMVTGYAWRVVMPVGAIYLIVLGVLFHFRPESQADMISLMKNLSLAGGMILLGFRSR